MSDQGRIGPYVLVGELGRGAMARVWRAWDPNLEREVAVKEPLFDPSLPDGVLEEMGRRFVAEGRAAARLSHPNVVAIHAADVWDGRPAIVMELVEGETLSKLLSRGPLAPAEALPLLDQLLDALGYAHGRGVVHRDVKPDNVFVTADGTLKLADFGIARVDTGATRATVAGSVLGTPGYMSPEQARGSEVDGRSDLFSVGVIAYEMLAGSNPFGSGDATTLLYRIVHEPVPELPPSASAGLPADLRPAVMAALSKDPADRPATAADMRRMLHGEEPLRETVKKTPPVDIHSPGGQSNEKRAGTIHRPSVQQKSSEEKTAKRNFTPYIIIGAVAVIALIIVFASAMSGTNHKTASSYVESSQQVPTKAKIHTITFIGAGGEGSMDECKVDDGGSFVVPKCAFTRDGYDFDLWIDESGKEYEPGDTIVPDANIILAARWIASASQNQSDASSQQPSSNPSTSTPKSPATTFPRLWSGTYVGTSSYVPGDHHINRAVALEFTTVSDDGYIEGVCYVGTSDTGPGETYGTCTISGNVDWDTGSIYFRGTGWIDQGGLGELREYTGTVLHSSQSMNGMAGDLGSGLYETPWEVRAVSEINILQNGNLTTVR